ncbi:MAG: FtsX-like permease family protein, partial [Dehalococcoidia bacterium]|nr:FtsX-like permease family protein [Dehalococcoidia bacterium]
LDRFGSNIIVAPKTDEVALSYGGIFVASTSVNKKDMQRAEVEKILAIPGEFNITNVSPKLVGPVLANGSKALLVGVNFEAELTAKKWWEITGNVPNAPDEVLLGSSAATKFAAMPGGKLNINGNDYSVVGVLRETGDQDDSVIFADLARTQEILGKPDAITFVEVSASSKSLNAIIAEISRELPDAKATALSTAMESTQQRINQLTNFSVAISIVVLLVGVLIVLTTMMSSVSERTREIGIFRATGFRKSHIMTIILFEAFVVSIAGGISGWLIGSAITFVLGAKVAQISAAIGPNPLLGAGAVVLSVLIGLAGAVYPARRASNLDPAEALRFM